MRHRLINGPAFVSIIQWLQGNVEATVLQCMLGIYSVFSIPNLWKLGQFQRPLIDRGSICEC